MNILIINGHPCAESFSTSIVKAYHTGASSKGHTVRLLVLRDLQFDLNLSLGYKTPLEHALKNAQEDINWADHLVFVYPTWWWTMPALLKGFIDRVFLPGFAFRYHEGKPLPEKLLKGKTASVIVTMDSPHWYYRFWMRNAGHHVIKEGVLSFCGVKTNATITIDNYRDLQSPAREKWLTKIESIARRL